MLQEDDIKNAIAKILNAVQLGRVFIVDRDKNLDFLKRTNLTKRAAMRAISRIEVNDYCDGPDVDRGGSAGEIWEFRKNLWGVQVYIKLLIRDSGSVKCISFHD